MEKSYRAVLKLWPNLNDGYCVFIIDVFLIDGLQNSDGEQRRNITIISYFLLICREEKKTPPEK